MTEPREETVDGQRAERGDVCTCHYGGDFDGIPHLHSGPILIGKWVECPTCNGEGRINGSQHGYPPGRINCFGCAGTGMSVGPTDGAPE